MNPNFSFVRFVALLAGATLGCSDAPEQPPPELEVNVLVTSERVEVHVHEEGSCREATAFPAANRCETFGWAIVSAPSDHTTSVCRPEPTCVSEVRLERDGEVVGSARGPSVGFRVTLAGAPARVVLEGCGDDTVIDLPAPLDGDVSFDVEAVTSGIAVEAGGANVSGVFARGASVPFLPTGEFISACRSDGATVELPTSDDFDAYGIAAFALGDAVSAGRKVRVFPARVHGEVVSEYADLDPAWEAGALLARQSSFWDVCEEYCTAWTEGCEVASDDPDACPVSCVLEGELSNCADEWEALVECLGASLTCQELAVETYAEEPSKRTSTVTPSCPEEETAHLTCMEGG